MTDKAELIRQARNMAKQRGHKIGEFLATRIETAFPPEAAKECLTAICEYCGAEVGIDGLEIRGQALERDCPGEVFI